MTRSTFLLALLAACAPEPPTDPTAGDTAPADGIVTLSPRDQLKRLSVDLRGVHPTEEESLAIEAHPELYDDFVERYLQDPRFLDRMEEIYNLRLWTRTGELYFDSADNEMMRGLDDAIVADSVNDEPLKLIRHIIDNDLPYTDVVRADYTVADPVTAWMWGVEIPAGSDGWVVGHYRDGRPERGILTQTTMWGRFPSAGSNSNRHRANTVTRTLLCDDFLARPVSFSRTQIDALTSGDPEDVIRDNDVCQSCHSSLDPLASHFYGFWWEIDGDFREQTTYRPEDEGTWREVTGKPPGWFGKPTTGLDELSERIANDDRFVTCAVKTVFAGLTHREPAPADWHELRGYEQTFRDEGLVVRALVRDIVTSREYRAEGTERIEGVTLDQDHLDGLVPVKMVSPSQLASIIEAKTGYRWSFRDRDGLTRNDAGLVVLAGGIDSRYVTTPSHDPSVGIVFVQERLAQAAGHHVALHDLDEDRTDEAILLRYVTVNDVPETNPEAFANQIRSLYVDVTGHALPEDAEEVEQLTALWKQLYSVNASPVQSWAGVVSVVLRDPAILFY